VLGRTLKAHLGPRQSNELGSAEIFTNWSYKTFFTFELHRKIFLGMDPSHHATRYVAQLQVTWRRTLPCQHGGGLSWQERCHILWCRLLMTRRLIISVVPPLPVSLPHSSLSQVQTEGCPLLSLSCPSPVQILETRVAGIDFFLEKFVE
jgi:hypothetical protein